MNQNTKILIVVLAAITIGFVIYITTEKNMPYATESWYESYAPTDKGPYGTYVFKELLDTTGIFESFIQIDDKIEDQLVDNENENDIYLFIGKENYMSDDAFTELLDFVSKGNTAFISAETMPGYLLDYFFLDMNTVYETDKDSIQSFKFLANEFKGRDYSFKYIKNNTSVFYNWIYFNPDNTVFQTAKPLNLGENSASQINFIEVPFHDGSFFFHSSPYLFTNISLFRFDGFSYAEDLIHHLPYGKIQWDIYNLNYQSVSDSDYQQNGDNDNRNKSVFQFIFQHTALIWAFGLLFLCAILYAIFKGKRRQNIVPAAEVKENSSLNYIETVSSLYLQERQHHKLIRLQKQSFIEFIGNHYYIRSHKIDDKYIAALSLKSGIGPDKITAIFSHLETLANQENVTDAELIGLQQKIEHFYKTCK